MDTYENFNDIIIIDIERDKTKPNNKGVLYDVYFKLSTNPSSEWIKIYENEKTLEWNSMSRPSRIFGKYLIIDCPMDKKEIQKNLDENKKYFEKTNKKYKQYLLEKEQDLKNKHQKQVKENNKKNDTLDKIDI